MARIELKKVRMQMLGGGEIEVKLSRRFGDKSERNKYRQTSCGNYKSMSYEDPAKTERAHAKCERCRLNNSETDKMCHEQKNPPKPKMTFAKTIKAKQEEKEEKAVMTPNFGT